MSTHSPIILAYPTGKFIDLGTEILGSSGTSGGEDVYKTLPMIRNVDLDELYPPIPCAGFSEVFIAPLGSGVGGTPTFYVYGVYTNKQAGSPDANYYVVKLLASFTTAFPVGGKLVPIPNPPNADFQYYTQSPSFVPAFSLVLDSVIGATSLNQAGSATVIGTVGIPHLAGAEYLIITSTSGDDAYANAMIWFN